MPPTDIDLGVPDAEGKTVYPLLVIKEEPSQELHFDDTLVLDIVCRVAMVRREDARGGVRYRAELEMRTVKSITP